MALQGFPGSKRMLIGLYPGNVTLTVPSNTSSTVLDQVNEAVIYIGQIETSDGGSHTIDTSGSSSIGWLASSVTFASGSTTAKVGLATIDSSSGPPGRAVNSSDVITFDVVRTMTGSGSPEIVSGFNTHVPNSGSKTIANGDLIAFAVQLTSTGGADLMSVVRSSITSNIHFPSCTSFLSGAYANVTGVPNCFIIFSDGATGWFYGGDVFSAKTVQSFNSGSTPDERGQLFQLPFPLKIYGAYGWVDPDADFDFVLYSDPLGTPVAEKTVSIDANTTASATGRYFEVLFSSPYQVAPDVPVAIVVKPGASSSSVYFKTLNSATHRVSDPWGAGGYGVTRTDGSGAFADENSSLNHYYLGLIAGAFDDGA